MKTVIATLKSEIANFKGMIDDKKSQLELLRERRKETPEEEMEMLELSISEYRDTISIMKNQLSDLRYCLHFALRSCGYPENELDIFSPETCKAIQKLNL